MAEPDDIFAEFLAPSKSVGSSAVKTKEGERPNSGPLQREEIGSSIISHQGPPESSLPSSIASLLMSNAHEPAVNTASSSSHVNEAREERLDVQTPAPNTAPVYPEELVDIKLAQGQTQNLEHSPFQFKIDAPQKQSKGGMLDAVYWVYNVTTKTGLPQFKARRVEASRRYSDFYFLREQLVKENRGCIVPKVPPKDLTVILEKVMHEFNSEHIVAERQRMLLHFLVAVGRHPLLHQSKTFRRFLEDTVADWATFVKDNADHTWATWLQGAAQQILAPAMPDVPSPPQIQPTPNKFSWHWERYRAACTAYELRKTGERIQSYNRSRALLARAMHEVGESLFEFAKIESGSLQQVVRDVGMKACDTSLVVSDQIDIEVTKIFESWMYHVLQAEATLESLDYILTQRHAYITLKKQEAESQTPEMAVQRKALELEVKKAQVTLKRELVRVRKEWTKDCETVLRELIKYQSGSMAQHYKIFVFGTL